MLRVQPKFPDNLAILERADLQSSPADRQKVFPIMSISKSFFGATCALMAVDGEFGEKGIDATLSEVLERAKSQHPNRREQIEAYQQLLRDKDFADVTVAEMLSHRSGFCDASEVKFGDYKGRSRLEFFREQMDRREFRRGEFHYSNEGFTLMEEILNLSSKTGSYEQELQNRILKPLGLVNTGSLYLSPEAMARVGEAVYLQGSEHPIRKVKLEAAIATFEKRLADQYFRSKAPADIIAAQEKTLAENKIKQTQLVESIDALK
jgi:CubicO group peptidase (beta-lactamase class C family)